MYIYRSKALHIRQIVFIISVDDPILQSLIESSTILDSNIEYAKQLEDWIEDKAFGWKLCYRASVDGWQAENFHRKCNGIGPTVIMVKCGTNVFGGYTDRSWEGINQ